MQETTRLAGGSSADMCRGPHGQQGGSSGGLCRHVQETAWPIDNVEVTLLHCDSYLSTCTSNRSVWMSFLMNWNSTHTSSGVGAYDTCMCPHVPNYMCHFITKRRKYSQKRRGKKYKVQSAKCKMLLAT